MARTVLRRAAVKLYEAPKFTAARPILRRLAQIFDALNRIKMARTVLRRAAVELYEAP